MGILGMRYDEVYCTKYVELQVSSWCRTLCSLLLAPLPLKAINKFSRAFCQWTLGHRYRLEPELGIDPSLRHTPTPTITVGCLED